MATPHSSPLHCLNCATPLLGNWCHACGQRAEPNHRSLRHVAAEMVAALTDADGRLWRTLRRLALQPPRLTRDYIEGRRTAELPPLRLFFIALLLFFSLGAVQLGSHIQGTAIDPAHLHHQLDGLHFPGRLEALLQADILHAAADPRAYFEVLRDWAQRFAVLMLPIATVLLSLIFVFNRRYSVFDHTIFAMHSLTFALLMLTLSPLLQRLSPWLSTPCLLVIPVHLYLHLSGTYRTGVIGTLIRMAVLAAGSLLGLVALTLGLAMIGLLLNGG